MFSLLDKQVSISRLQNFIQWQKFATTYQALLLALCGAKQLRWQSQHLQHCISLDSHVRPLPCLAWAKCLPSRRGGRSVPCSRRQAPKINENIDGLQRFIDCATSAACGKNSVKAFPVLFQWLPGNAQEYGFHQEGFQAQRLARYHAAR